MKKEKQSHYISSTSTGHVEACHQSDMITYSQCCQICADGGDVPNETKLAKTIAQ